MPEYLTPGAYVAETSPRARAVEGAPTSTFGMTGVTEYGPTPIPGLARVHSTLLAAGPGAARSPGPVLVTSFAGYERVFGGLTIAGRPCHLAHAARLFFDNGGRRLYVARVFAPTMDSASPQTLDVAASFASLRAPALNPVLRWQARWPGSMGARIRVSVALRRGDNALVGGVLRGLRAGAAVEVAPVGSAPPTIPDEVDPVPANVKIVTRGSDGVLGYLASDGACEAVDPAAAAFPLTFTVTVRCGDRVDVYDELELDPRSAGRHPRSVFDVLRASEPPDEHGLVSCDLVGSGSGAEPSPGDVASALLSLRTEAPLRGGGDGERLTADLLRGNPADADGNDQPARGLGALADIDEIAIVAVPDAASLAAADRSKAVDDLIAHCEDRFRFAVVDPPPDCSVMDVRTFRSGFDSALAALYYPWLRVVDPTDDPATAPRSLLDVPPSGAVAGIYVRTDLERGVHKAPANEVVHGIAGLAVEVTQSQQDVLHPEGINVIRSFEGRGRRVWGGRTMGTDPDWKYVNVRRLLSYLEQSIVRSTQWVVFEPNDERLWSSVSGAIEDFLFQEWTAGALRGAKPEDAFLVRCDRTTMTQRDLGDGRLVCLVGVAAVRPAEFILFRVAQWTADARHG